MKISKLLSILGIGALLAAACGKTEPEPELPGEAGYVGHLSVIEIAGALFEMEDIRATYELEEDGTLDVSLYDVSFSSKMPVLLSRMVLPDVPYTRTGNQLTLSSTAEIIPLMEMRGELVPYERYVCTDLTGTLTTDCLVLSMKLGGFQTDYTGAFAEQ